MKKIVFTFLFLTNFLIGFAVENQHAQTIFEEASLLYQAGKFEDALKKYQTLEEDFSSFDLFYNLGNTYYKLNKTPDAILYYEKAKKINPSDEDLKTNLLIANQKVIDKIDKLPTLAVAEIGNRFLSKSTLDWWAWGSIILFLVAILLFILFLRNKSNSKSRAPLLIGILLFFLAITSYFIGTQGASKLDHSKEAIIFTSKVDVLNQPNGDQTAFVLHSGTKVNIRKNEGDWMEIKIDNGSVGWIKSTDCREI